MLKSYSWLVFCIVVWGSNFVFGKILVQFFSPSMLTMLRLVMIVLFLGILSVFYRKREKIVFKRDWLIIILLGIVGVFINQWSFFVGLETADPTTAALILAMTPILTGFLAAIFLKEKMTVRMGFGSVVAIIGIYYVVTSGAVGVTNIVQVDEGLLWIVLTMITFAILIIMTRYLGGRIDPYTVTLYSNVVGLVVAVPFAFLFDSPVEVSGDVSHWALLIGTAVIVHGLATFIWNNHIRYVDASKASILSNLEPFVAMVVGLVLLAKPITGIEIMGSLLIVSGVLISTYQKRKTLQQF